MGGQDDAEVTGFDRDLVLISEQVLREVPSDRVTLGRVLHPLFDEIANAAGWTKSPLRD